MVAVWITRGRFGAQLIAVRENEEAARALGVKVLRTKVAALAVSGAITALGGVLYTQTYLYIDPIIAFGPERSVEMLLVTMIGGAGTVAGPILGALALHLVADTARTSADWYATFPEHMKLDRMDFAYSYIMRSGRIDTTPRLPA